MVRDLLAAGVEGLAGGVVVVAVAFVSLTVGARRFRDSTGGRGGRGGEDGSLSGGLEAGAVLCSLVVRVRKDLSVDGPTLPFALSDWLPIFWRSRLLWVRTEPLTTRSVRFPTSAL